MLLFLAAPLIVFFGVQLVLNYYDCNIPLFQFINGANLGPDWLWQNITFLGDSLPGFVLLIFFIRRHPPILWQGFLITLALGIGVQAAKHLGLVSRPAAVLDPQHIHVIGQLLRNYSFPSGHSVAALAMAALLTPLLPKPARYPLLALACVVAWSRVVVGAHWPGDVITGGLCGWYGTHAVLNLTKSWTWGFTQRWGQVCMHGIWVVAAVALWWHDGGYPMAEPLARVLSVSALVFWGWTWWVRRRGGVLN